MQTEHPQKPAQAATAPLSTEAQLMAADREVEKWKAGHNERNERRALELQIRGSYRAPWGVA